jgi:hypothetical protein
MSNQCARPADISSPAKGAHPNALAAGLPSAAAPHLSAVTAAPRIHRPQPAPLTHRCTCGRLREACLHDCILALWRF